MTELSPIDTLPRRARLKAADFELLDRHGAFAAYRKTELIDGDVYVVNAQHRPHGMVKMRLYDSLSDALRKMQLPLRAVTEFTLSLSPVDRPEPDLMLTSEPDGPGFVPVESVSLVIEVSDTTRRIDLGRKLRRYAVAGVPEYWVADLNERVIHRMWSPVGDTYARRDEVRFGEVANVVTVEGLAVATDEL